MAISDLGFQISEVYDASTLAAHVPKPEPIMNADQNPMRQRTKAFALRIIRLSEALPRTNVGWVIGKQLLKLGTSIGANYCEALRASSRAHFISILEVSLREASETKYWLELLNDGEIVKASLLTELERECEELIRILAATIKSTKQRQEDSTSEI
jgi:four helix bundle protein